jgi:nitroimidazol reductase NimA-like FMN-containing flavoprotein (pyridoxamine 5'-phosphate oxidase superfamily)
MRRHDKQIIDPETVDTIIRQSEVCRLALALDNEPYLVPVNFGYDGVAIYLHTATSGRKIDFFEKNPRICFEFEGDCQLVSNPERACRWTMNYSSVIGYGTLRELVTDEEKRFGLNQIMRHYSGRDWEFPANELPPTRLWRIDIESLSGKCSPAIAVH